MTSQEKTYQENGLQLRVITYNVRRCQGRDGRISCDRIADVLAELDPDIVALQELDVGRPRSGAEDQPRRIAERLGMEHVFHASMQIDGGYYGNATLSRFPLEMRSAMALPKLSPGGAGEIRSALWVSLEVCGQQVQVVNTHLGLRRRERALQISRLLGPEWLGSPECTGAVIFCGDLNSLPGSRVYRQILQVLDDACLQVPGSRPARTFTSRFPLFRIDHVFVAPACRVLACHVPRAGLAALASDHLPLAVDLVVQFAPGQTSERRE